MNYIIVKGSKNAGKSKTINEVCRRLKPDRIQKLFFKPTEESFIEEVNPATQLLNETYIISLKNKNILVVAGSPTGQRRNITVLVEAIRQKGIPVHFAIIAIRSLEKLSNFSTVKELTVYGNCIYETKIRRIPAHNYSETEEWNRRIEHLVFLCQRNL